MTFLEKRERELVSGDIIYARMSHGLKFILIPINMQIFQRI